MKTINASATGSLPIGFCGEQNRTRVRFSFGDLMDEFPGGTVLLQVKRPKENKKYDVQLEINNGFAYWVISGYDTEIRGRGECQLIYTVDGVIAKKKAWETVIDHSIEGKSISAPPTWEDIESGLIELYGAANQLRELIKTIPDDIHAAHEDAESAAESMNAALSAKLSAESARDAAVSARVSAESARDLANTSSESATNAKTAAIAAQLAAESAADTADDAKDDAESARDAAISAKNTSVASQASAEAAASNAATYMSTAQVSASNASGYMTSAQAAASNASTYMDAAQAAMSGALDAQAAAEAAISQYNSIEASVTELPPSGHATGRMDYTGENPVLMLEIPKGDTGSSGVYVGSDEPEDPNVNVWINPNGSDSMQDIVERVLAELPTLSMENP